MSEPSCSGPSCRGYSILGKLFTHYAIPILVIVTSGAVTLAWIGLAQNGFPEFGDPYLGFQTRFTPISDRLVTLENFRLELNKMNALENYPGERLGEKESRRKRSIGFSGACADEPLEDHSRLALELNGEASTSILSKKTLSLICYFQQLVTALLEYDLLCEFDETQSCCPMWSLPNYVALFSNKSDCVDILDEDVERFREGLQLCQNFYTNLTADEDCLFRRSNCPTICQHGQILQSALYYTMDRFSLQKNATKYAMIILPIAKISKAQSTMEFLQKRIWNLRKSLPQELTSLVGFEFGGKNAIFESYLVSDLEYVGVASFVIFCIVLIFTKSFFVTVISFGMLVLSLGISYYLYKNVFAIPYFPFMNMLVTIIILGIGTDATLIVSSAWRRACACIKIENGRTRRELIMIETLKETTVTLVITTCTTAGAFFASLLSSITTIRCFSIFAGTAIVISFLLLYICVPISLDCSDRFWRYFKALFPLPSQSKLFLKMKASASKLSTFCCSFPLKFSKVRLDATTSLTFWACSFVTCGSFLLAAIFIVFYSPGLQLPNIEQFQLLSANHPVEAFERLISPAFGEPSAVEEYKLSVYLIWGLIPKDTGNGLDPSNTGSLSFDAEFSVTSPESQKWLKKLCKKVQKIHFYDALENGRLGRNLDSCFMTTFVGWMKRDCHRYVEKDASHKPCCNSSKFPYSSDTVTQCIGQAARNVYRTPSLYFQPDVAGPKFFVNETMKMASFAVRIQTNVTYSVAYEKMHKVYKDFEQTFHEILKDAPAGLKNGFFVSSQFDFYDLQRSLLEETWSSLLLSIGLCFIFLWISSRSFSIALGAAISVFAIVLVTSGVMILCFDWKLGVFESIAATVAVGLSDFTAHHSIEFSKEKSVMNMTRPTFFSAISTVVMGLCMYLFSSVLVYQQIGSFFFVLVVTSWIYSVLFLTPILLFLDHLTLVAMTTASHLMGHSSVQRPDDPTSDDDDVNSNSDLIVENLVVTQIGVQERKSDEILDKWKQLKKYGQETPV